MSDFKRDDSKLEETVFDADTLVGSTYLKGDRFDSESERYDASIENIYQKLKPIWLNECRDAVWLLQEEYIREVARLLYLDDKMGGNLDVASLPEAQQNLLGWKQIQAVIERYRALDYSLVDENTTKAILSGIIKNKSARDADRLKAIEMYNNLFSGEHVEGITFINDISDIDKSKIEKMSKRLHKDR